MSHDQKVMTLLTPMGSALWTFIKELFLLPKFDKISPPVTRDKEICKNSCDYELMVSLPLEAKHPVKPFE